MDELIIKQEGNLRQIAIVNNGILEEFYKENTDDTRLDGNIYLGIVKNVLPGLGAAFIDIGTDKNAYLNLKDIVPKESNVTGNKEENLEKYNIKEFTKPGRPLLVQVKRDEVDKKGARVSTNIQLPGRYSIFLIENSFATVSQKIKDEKERERLKSIAQEIIEKKYENSFGVILRTAAEGKSKEEIESDIDELVERWNSITSVVRDNMNEKKPTEIMKASTILEKIILDLTDKHKEEITLNSEAIEEEIMGYASDLIKDNKVKITIEKERDVFEKYNLNKQISDIDKREIYLNCGGFITIDRTEALTAIDVNTGKYVGNENLEKTIMRVNKEAAMEIARQLRLRDIGGIVVIDFIDMDTPNDPSKIQEILEEELKKDRSKTQIIGFTKLDLLEMTRKSMFS